MEQGFGYIAIVNAAGVLIIAGFLSLLYNLITRQVSSRRRLSSALGLLMLSLLGGIYLNFVAAEYLGQGFAEPGFVRWSFVLAYLMLGCLFLLVSWIDRKEYREFVKPAERLAENVNEALASTGHAPAGEDADGGS